jgi:hypothetical protein
MRIALTAIGSVRESRTVTTTALVEDASPEAAPVGAARPGSELARFAVLGAALVVGLPGVVELSRLLTTILLSLVLGH